MSVKNRFTMSPWNRRMEEGRTMSSSRILIIELGSEEGGNEWDPNSLFIHLSNLLLLFLSFLPPDGEG